MRAPRVPTAWHVGRVLAVTLVDEDAYRVTLGPPPHMLSFTTGGQPPKLGQLLRVEAQHATRKEIVSGTTRGSLTLLTGVRAFTVEAVAVERTVAPAWRARVSQQMSRPLRPYQVEGAAWLASRLSTGRGAILADEPGTGKTTQTIAGLLAVGLFPALVVCPASLKINWAREVQFAKAPAPSVCIVRGKRGALPHADVYVANYALLGPREPQWLRMRLRVVVYDEAHELASPKPGAASQHRAAVATRLSAAVGRSVLLTGSPMLHRPIELWRLLHLADPEAWPALSDFVDRYCKAPSNDEAAARGAPGRRLVTSVGRVENLDELQTRMAVTMIRRRKEDVLKDLPPKSRRSILVELDPADMRRYRAAERDVLAWLRAQQHDTRAASRAMALVKLATLRQIAALGKLRTAVPKYLAEWFNGGGRPLIIFGYHRAVLYGDDDKSGVVGLCRDLSLATSVIRSSDKDDVRQAAVDAFNAGATQVFVAPIRAAGVGLNLQRASDLLFLERVWSPFEMGQAEDRAHRLGQTRAVEATYLDAAGTIDEHMAEVLEAKQRIGLRVMDDRGAGTRESFTLVDDLLARHAREAERPQPQAHPPDVRTGRVA